MTYDMYRNIFIGAATLSGIMIVVSILMFIFWKIPKIIGILSGATARKSINSIREQNENFGDKTYKTYKTNTINRERGKLTDKISKSGSLVKGVTNQIRTGVVTSKISTKQLESTNETTVLYSDETTLLNTSIVDNETAILWEPQVFDTNLFKIEVDITYIHTEEVIE